MDAENYGRSPAVQFLPAIREMQRLDQRDIETMTFGSPLEAEAARCCLMLRRRSVFRMIRERLAQ